MFRVRVSSLGCAGWSGKFTDSFCRVWTWGGLSTIISAMPTRNLTSAIALSVLFGVIGLGNVMRQPRFQSFHNVDVLQLLVSGMCFGVALSALFALLRRSRTTPEV
jgi:hypothetical protein